MSIPFHRLFCWLLIAGLMVGLTTGGGRRLSAEPVKGPLKDFVWRVQGTNGVLFLAGSLHELRARDRPSASHYDAYALSDRIAFEADLSEIMQPEFRREVTRLARLPPGESLTKRLDAATLDRLHRLAQRHELPEDEFERYRPWFAGNYVALLMLSDAGFEEDHGTDRMFFDRAVREGKAREFLETARQQLETLTSVPETETIAALQRDLVSGVDQAEAFVEAWKTGNAAALDRMMAEERVTSPVTIQRMLTARNAAWIPRLEQWLAQTNCTLVLVGAAHLVGTNGLVHVLDRRGHSVEQMPLVR